MRSEANVTNKCQHLQRHDLKLAIVANAAN